MKREARVLVWICSSGICAAAVIREYSMDSLLLSGASVFCSKLSRWSYMNEVRYVFPGKCCSFEFPPVSSKSIKTAETFYRFLAYLIEEVGRVMGENGLW